MVRFPAEWVHGGNDRGETSYGMTVFPQPLGLAAAFDKDMLHEIAGIISEEMRAASNMYRQADGTARLLSIPITPSPRRSASPPQPHEGLEHQTSLS